MSLKKEREWEKEEREKREERETEEKCHRSRQGRGQEGKLGTENVYWWSVVHFMTESQSQITL